jgi:hypothetical protein
VIPKKPIPKKSVPKKPVPKKNAPKKEPVKIKELVKDTKAKERAARIKRIKEDNKRAREAQLRKDRAAKEARIKREQEAKARAKKAQIKKDRAAKERARQAQIKKDKEAKERERARQARIKRDKEAKERAREQERARQARIKKEREAKERSRDLFSSVDTQTPRRVSPPQESRVRHNSSVTDRIRNTHQSGTVSNRNRERGVENAYIAKVQRRLNNWHAQSNYKGQSAKIKLVIKSSGHFRFTILRSSSGSLSAGLRDFMEQLNRMGLGRHDKSTPYNINVTFKAK